MLEKNRKNKKEAHKIYAKKQRPNKAMLNLMLRLDGKKLSAISMSAKDKIKVPKTQIECVKL